MLLLGEVVLRSRALYPFGILRVGSYVDPVSKPSQSPNKQDRPQRDGNLDDRWFNTSLGESEAEKGQPQ